MAHKSSGKSRSSAKASKKAASRTYAKQEKPAKHTPAKAGAAPVVQASLFGTPSLAAKHSDAKKTKVALIGTPKNQTKGPAAKGKKSGETRLAKKSDNSAKSVSQTQENQFVQQTTPRTSIPSPSPSGPSWFPKPGNHYRASAPHLPPNYFYRPPCFSRESGYN